MPTFLQFFHCFDIPTHPGRSPYRELSVLLFFFPPIFIPITTTFRFTQLHFIIKVSLGSLQGDYFFSLIYTSVMGKSKSISDEKAEKKSNKKASKVVEDEKVEEVKKSKKRKNDDEVEDLYA